jgi:hypothetical protein
MAKQTVSFEVDPASYTGKTKEQVEKMLAGHIPVGAKIIEHKVIGKMIFTATVTYDDGMPEAGDLKQHG